MSHARINAIVWCVVLLVAAGLWFFAARTRLHMVDPLSFIAVVGVVNGFVLGALALAPNLGVAVGMNLVISTTISVQAPVMFALLSMVVPAHVRSLGFTTLMIFSVPGIVVLLPLLGAMADSFGLQVAMLVMVPVAIVAALILLSATPFISDDIARSHGGVPAAVRAVPTG